MRRVTRSQFSNVYLKKVVKEKKGIYPLFEGLVEPPKIKKTLVKDEFLFKILH